MPVFLSDEAIADAKQDLLGRGPLVEQLSDYLRRWPFQQALAIALHGARGDGKTSVVNLLAQRLQRGRSDFIVAELNPWYYNSQEEIIQGFLTTLSQALTKEVDRSFVEEAQGIVTDVRQKLSVLPPVSVFGFGLDFSKLKAGEPSLDDLWLRLGDLVARAHKRIVVLMDDLDRVPKGELLLLLKLIKLWSVSRKVVYVLACERGLLEERLRDELAEDSEFLRRIVAVEVYLPRPDRQCIDHFWQAQFQALVGQLKLAVDDHARRRAAELYDSALAPLVPNLRAAKRLLNSLAVSLPLAGGRVDLADFLALEAARTFFPQVYAGLPAAKKSLLRGQVEPCLAKVSDQERREVIHRLLEWVFTASGPATRLGAGSAEHFDAYFPFGGVG